MENNLIITEKRFWLILSGFLGVIVFLSILLLFQGSSHRKDLARQLRDLTAVKDGFSLQGVSEEEQYFKFKSFMIRIMNVYGNTYDPKNPHAVPPDEQSDYIKFCWQAAKLMKMSPYRIPVIHQMESCFDPWANNTNSGLDEKGIGQQCWTAALYGLSLRDFLPPNLKSFFQVDFKYSDELYQWEVSTKLTFILMYFLDREFHGRDEWALSVYHWGGFLRRHWNEGNGNIPVQFYFEKGGKKIKYSVIDYWLTAEKLIAAYEQGDLEYGKAISRVYDEKKTQLMQEEKQLRRAREIIRELRNQIATEKEARREAVAQRSNLEAFLLQATVDMWKIYGKAGKKTTGEAVRAELVKNKALALKVVKRLQLDELERIQLRVFQLRWGWFGRGVLFILILGGIFGFAVWKSREKKHE